MFARVSEHDIGKHWFRGLRLKDLDALLRAAAAEYVALRTETAVALSQVTVEGVDVFSVADIEKRLKRNVIPAMTGGAFDVTRADFAEVVAYLSLGDYCGTRFGYKGVRDRERFDLPGRGIDGVGVEVASPVALILTEVKVGDEGRSPPRVVDKTKDCLRYQHRAHLREHKKTVAKIWDLVRHVRDPDIRDLLVEAAIRLEDKESLNLVCCNVLLRSEARYSEKDFGTFRDKPEDFSPANIRFLIVCTETSVDEAHQRWYALVQEEASR